MTNRSPICEGTGIVPLPYIALPNGSPYGRSECPVCHWFYGKTTKGVLPKHRNVPMSARSAGERAAAAENCRRPSVEPPHDHRSPLRPVRFDMHRGLRALQRRRTPHSTT